MKPINLDNIEVDIFQEVRNRLNLRQIVSFYGCGTPKHNYICCPFHTEKTPSMRIYDYGFNCYGCGAKGGMIDFVMKLFGISNIEAVRKLNEDFCLNLDIGHISCKRKPVPKVKPITKHDVYEHYMEWETLIFRELNWYYKLLRYWFKVFAPKPGDETTYPLFQKACNELPLLDSYCRFFCETGNPEHFDEIKPEYIQFYKEHGEEVEELAEEYRSFTGYGIL